MKCQKCGAREATRIVNGMHVCDSCAFFLENAQCYRCQMWLPRSELVMYKGQLYCQYCLQDIREEEIMKQKRLEEEQHHHEEYKAPSYYSKKPEYKAKREFCERCGRELYTVYIVNGKKLCKTCADEELKKAAAKGLRLRPIIYHLREKPLLLKIFEWILSKLGIIKEAKKEKANIKVAISEEEINKAKADLESREEKESEGESKGEKVNQQPSDEEKRGKD